MWDEANAIVIGPGPNILSQTGDKLEAKRLAENCQVPVLQALATPTRDVAELEAFGESVGYPIIIKAVDGGGGRGIRVVRKKEDLPSLARRAMQESPSGMVFAEMAAIDGFRHVEVQIVGDGKGDVRHLWERECSIQRRFQKVVEFAPSSIKDRSLTAEVINAALRMAKSVGPCFQYLPVMLPTALTDLFFNVILVFICVNKFRSTIPPWEPLNFLHGPRHQLSTSWK